MRHLSWIVTVPVTVVAVIFAVANRADATLRFWPLPWSVDLPVYLIVLGSLFAGFLLGGFMAWLASAPRRRRARRTAERARELARELAELRRRQAEQSGGQDGPSGDRQAAGSAPHGQATQGGSRPAQRALEHLPGA